MIERVAYVVLLKDFYGPLLTEKQQYILHLHYENDWSLSEIAADLNSSRQAVYDTVKRAEHSLEQYEQKLGLVKRFQSAQKKLQELTGLLDKPENRHANIDKAVTIIKQLGEII
jgi:predicted DNA-binding protein YlxM (UPF0122 family)